MDGVYREIIPTSTLRAQWKLTGRNVAARLQHALESQEPKFQRVTCKRTEPVSPRKTCKSDTLIT